MTKYEYIVELFCIYHSLIGKKETLIMDPIHGFINISEYKVLEELVDSKFFQRLRRLSQLGMVSAVYPSATHTRFSHCLGVMHVFLTLFDSISRRATITINDCEHKRTVGAVTALLHDLGHGPFSHVSEYILSKGKFDHLDMTCKIISNTEITDILKKYSIEPNIVCDILNHQTSPDWNLLSQLISSQLDADRLDYLLRDSYFTGANYGKIDISRISNTLEIWPNEGIFNGTAIVNPKGISAIENFILGRSLMYKKVAYHKITRCMELLLIKIFERALSNEDPELKSLINFDKEITPEQIYKLDDNICLNLFHRWTSSDDPVLKDLATRIIERGRLTTYPISIDNYLTLNLGHMEKIINIFKESDFPHEYYFINDYSQKSAYDQYFPELIDDGFSPISHIMTYDEDNQLSEISEKSQVIKVLSNKNIETVNLFFPDEISEKIIETVKDK